jgi:murein DD-endopeptidase MepM/ murein hydrolase activator NlpD
MSSSNEDGHGGFKSPSSQGTELLERKEAPFVTAPAHPYEDDILLLPLHRRFLYNENGSRREEREYLLQLGDCVFTVSPELIRVRTESRSQKARPIRQPGPLSTQAGYMEREVHVTLYFTSTEEINGFPCPGPNGSTYYMDGLRSMVAMIRMCPILPVVNQHLNFVHDIHAVMVASVGIQSIEGFPGTFAVELALRPIAVESLLLFSGDLFGQINWPLFRWHYQRKIGDGVPGETKKRYATLYSTALNDSIGFDIVDSDRLGNDPWDAIHYVPATITEPLYVQGISMQFQNIVVPMQTQAAGEPFYQYMGGTDATVLLQIRTADEVAAAQLQQMQLDAMALARTFHNRVVTSPIRIEHSLLNALGVAHVMIEAVDMQTVPGFPGVMDCNMALTSYEVAQSRAEQLKSFSPAKQYPNLMEALLEKDPKNVNFIEQSILAEEFLSSEQLYPDLELPTLGEVKKVCAEINQQRAKLGLAPIPVPNPSPMDWGENSFVDPDFWMTYPGLMATGIVDLDSVQIPADVRNLLSVDDAANLLKKTMNLLEDFDRNRPLQTIRLRDIPLVRDAPALQAYINRKLVASGVKRRNEDYFIESDVLGISIQQEMLDFQVAAEKAGGNKQAAEALQSAWGEHIGQALMKLQRNTGLSAVFWLGLVAKVSSWGTMSNEPGPLSDHLRSHKNYFRLEGRTHSQSVAIYTDEKGNEKSWLAYKTQYAGIAEGGITFSLRHLSGMRSSVENAARPYVRRQEDVAMWANELADLMREILKELGISEEFLIQATAEAKDRNLKELLEMAAAERTRPYGSFDMYDGESHRKPRMLSDKTARLAGALHNSVRYSHRGRLSRAFPTYQLVFIDEGGQDNQARKIWSNFYMYHSLLSMDLIRERNNPADVLALTLTNVYGTLNWRSRHRIPVNTSLAGDWKRIMDGLLFNWDNSNQYLLEHRTHLRTHFDLRPGQRVHLRLGYSGNAAMLPVVFNGSISELEFGEQIQLIAQSDGQELLQPVVDMDGSGTEGENKTFAKLDNTVSGHLLKLLAKDSSGVWDRILGDSPPANWIGAQERKVRSYWGLEHYGAMSFGARSFRFGALEMQSRYERYKNIYPGDYNHRLPPLDEGFVESWMTTLGGWMDKKAHDWFAQIQANDNEPYVFVDTNGKTVWDIFKICENACPGYVSHTHYHGFDSRMFFGMPMWQMRYNWRINKNTKLAKGEPVSAQQMQTDYAELERPFTQIHYAHSLTDILGNGIRTSNDFPTVAIGVYGFGDAQGTSTFAQYADIRMRPDMQRVETVDLGIYRDVAGPDKFYEYMGWTNFRQIAIAATRAHLAKRMGDMYTGDLILVGDSAISPCDLLHIIDTHWTMAGNVWVNRVTHHMSIEGGFMTTIEPKAVALSTDEIAEDSALMSLIGSFYGQFVPSVRATISTASGLLAIYALKRMIGPSALGVRGSLVMTAGALGEIGLAGVSGIGSLYTRLGGALAVYRGKRIRMAIDALKWTFGSGWMKSTFAVVGRAAAATPAAVTATSAGFSAMVAGFNAGRAAGSGTAQALSGAVNVIKGVSVAGRALSFTPYAAVHLVTAVLTGALTYWVQGVIERFYNSRNTIILMPISYRDGFMVGGVEAWRDLIPGWPDPRYVYVESQEQVEELYNTGRETSSSSSTGSTRIRSFQSPLKVAGVVVTSRYGKLRTKADLKYAQYRAAAAYKNESDAAIKAIVARELGGGADTTAPYPHGGLDLAVEGGGWGTPIYPVQEGVVEFWGFNKIYGYHVKIRHDALPGDQKYLYTLYAHMADQNQRDKRHKLTPVKVGDAVGKNTVIGLMDSTGFSTGPHLHLEFIVGGQTRDPGIYLKL